MKLRDRVSEEIEAEKIVELQTEAEEILLKINILIKEKNGRKHMKFKVHWIIDGIAEIEGESKEDAEKLQESLEEYVKNSEDLMNKFIAKSIQGTAYLEGEKDKEKQSENEKKGRVVCYYFYFFYHLRLIL